MNNEKFEKEAFICPMGRFLSNVDKVFDTKSAFFQHMKKSQIEFLRAIKSLVDGSIDTLEKKGSGNEKMTKIKVE